MKIRVIYGLPCVLNIADVIKICNNTSNKGLSHYFSKKKKELALCKGIEYNTISTLHKLIDR